MNINFTLQCDACGEDTNVRFGMSNRAQQPVRFACQSCGTTIDIDLDSRDMHLSGATRVEGKQPFDADTNFVDLHLDFPVSFEPYQMGMTPFMRAAGRVEFEKMQLHGSRLSHLDTVASKARNFRTILKLYAKSKLVPFKLNVERFFEIKVTSDKPQDVNAALYRLIALMMAAYEYPGQNRQTVDDISEVLFEVAEKHRAEFDEFLQTLIDNNFLKNLQLDILEVYPKILDAELVMRPALFLDFDRGYAANPIPMRISAKDFETYKDLYKDISEIISRELILVAAINNLAKRGSVDAFAPRIARNGRDQAPSNLDAFADLAFGQKESFIDDSWHQSLEDAIDNRLRNAIAHYKTEYDDISQLVTYFPRKEGLAQDQGEQIYFLEFVRRLLSAYREMHRLHHLVKSLFYFVYLVTKKPA